MGQWSEGKKTLEEWSKDKHARWQSEIKREG